MQKGTWCLLERFFKRNKLLKMGKKILEPYLCVRVNRNGNVTIEEFALKKLNGSPLPVTKTTSEFRKWIPHDLRKTNCKERADICISLHPCDCILLFLYSLMIDDKKKKKRIFLQGYKAM